MGYSGHAVLKKTEVARALAAARRTAPAGAGVVTKNDIVAELSRVSGLGTVRARRLHDELGIRSLAELADALEHGRVGQLRGFGGGVTARLAAALQPLLHDEPRIAIVEADVHVERLLAYMQRAPAVDSVEAAGSYRRRRATIGDINLLAVSAKPAAVMRYFTMYADAASASSTDLTRGALTLHCGLRVELRIVPARCYGATLHHLTGSADYNDAIRAVGLERGVRVSEYGVFRLDAHKAGARRLGGQREEHIFDALGMQWIPPELRENRGEIEAALQQRLPQLVALRDIRGDLRLRSRWSDGTASIEELMRACRKLGYAWCAIADPLRAASPRGLVTRTLREQAAEIAALRPRYPGLHVLHGVFVAIMPDGTLDLHDDEAAAADLVIAAVLPGTRLTPDRMTDRILRALEDPRLDVLAYPTGRIIGERAPLDIDTDTILAAVAQHGIAVELSAEPHRLDPPAALLRRASQLGVMIALGSGAGSADQLASMRFGVGQARRGWLEPAAVLNTLGYDGILHWLRRRETAVP
jgi:DNA polymerase (family X)